MKYKVGDKVKIKTWKRMVVEFGINRDSIKCFLSFTPDMERKIEKLKNNRTLIISRVSEDIDGKIYYEAENFKNSNGRSYVISHDMIVGYLPTTVVKGIENISRFELMEL